MAWTRMPRLLPAVPRSRATCTHSSRVGTTTSACGTPSAPSAGATIRCSIGTPKPRVLPVPVRACPMRSWPASARGSVSSWIAKVRVMPTSARAATTSGWMSKSLNSGAVSSTGAPPSCSTSCSIASGAGAPVSARSRSGVLGVFSVGVSSLASGRLGEQAVPRRIPPDRRCPGFGVAGSVPAPTPPADRASERVAQVARPEWASLGVRQRADTCTSEPDGPPIPMVAEATASLGAPRRECGASHSEGEPVAEADTRAVVDLLGVLAYAELTAFDRLAEDARLAPSLQGRAALAGMAVAEMGHFTRLRERLVEHGADPTGAMTPFVRALDAFHESTRPSTWLEGLVKAYVGDGLAADFYREIASFLPSPDRELVLDVLAATGHAAFAVREVRAAIQANRTVAGRLALWGRRLVGEAISQSQAVIGEHDQLAELIIAGTGDLAGIGRLIERITAAHTDRMKRLGLNP